MNTNVDLGAPIGALGFIAIAFTLFVAVLVVLYALRTRRRVLAGRVMLLAAALVGFYAVCLSVFSLASTEKVLARGEEKYFCELDCHLAYSVLNVRRTKTIGEGNGQATANGMFYVVTIRTRFDEQTISPRRGNQPLRPNGRSVRVIGADASRYAISTAGQRALELSGGAGTPLTTPLRPGESYTTDLVFDLPPEVKEPRLLINEGAIVTRFIIGHENSLLHKKTEFQI